jgi:hypothetical protein
MAIVQVSANTCIFINPKAGSRSMRYCINNIPHDFITIDQAKLLDRRVVFFRDPIERVKSLFNQLWDLAINNSGNDLITSDTIMAYGGRIDGTVGLNEHHWKDSKRQKYLDKKIEKQKKHTKDEDIIKELNNDDYKRFVDYILSGVDDDHWGQQYDLCTANNEFIPNIAHEFNDQINVNWAKYCALELPIIGHHKEILVDDYRLGDLEDYYSNDIEMLANVRAADGNWHSDS